MKLPKGYIVFYDGLCPMCNAVVRILLKYDHKQQLYFATLQGAIAQEFLNERRISDEDTVILWHPKAAYWIRSEAVFELAKLLGGPFLFLRPFRFLPRSFTDFSYNLIANNRFRWTSPYMNCPLPPKEHINRFL